MVEEIVNKLESVERQKSVIIRVIAVEKMDFFLLFLLALFCCIFGRFHSSGPIDGLMDGGRKRKGWPSNTEKDLGENVTGTKVIG